MERQRMAQIFNEWARRYASDPTEFTEMLDADGKPFSDYGDLCAAYFAHLDSDLRGTLLCRLFGHSLRIVDPGRGIAGPLGCHRCKYVKPGITWPSRPRA